MTGANYTGGKRNFARARFRDSTRRAQKSHFGRRRLEILSRDLGNGAYSNSKQEESYGISGILLEHAQREFSHLPEYMHSNRTEGPGTFSLISSPFISENIIKPSQVVHTLGSESYPSLRAEANRVLKFSRTVGLCNYRRSFRRHSGLASLASDVDSELRLGSPRQRIYCDGSPPSEFSERQHFGAPLDVVSPGSGNLAHFGSFRKPPFSPARRIRERNSGYTEPPSDYERQPRKHHTPQRNVPLINTLEPQLSQDSFFPGFSGGIFCAMDSFSPSFDVLEFPTSPLPPSSPLPSSTVHGSLLSLSHGTLLDFDTTPARGSCDAGSPSRSGYARFITPDFAPESVSLQHMPHSPRFHEVPTPHCMPSPSNADLIPEFLMRDNPWNAIGDMLDLPPIPAADETYFMEITSHRTVSRKRVSPLASSSSIGRADRVMPSSLARIEDTWLLATQSDGTLPATNSVSQGVKSSHLGKPPLLYGDLDSAISQESQSRSVGSSGQRGTNTPSLEIGSLPILDELSQPQLESHTSPASLRGLGHTPDRNNFSTYVTRETPSDFATPLRSLSQPSHLLMTSALSSPDSMHWNTISEIDLDALIPKSPSAQATMTRTQRPKLLCHDLFDIDDLRRMS